MGFEIALSKDSVQVKQTDTTTMSDTSVQFILNGPVGGRHLVWNAASSFTIGELPPGEYSLSRDRYGEKGVERSAEVFTLPPETKPEPAPKATKKKSKKDDK